MKCRECGERLDMRTYRAGGEVCFTCAGTERLHPASVAELRRLIQLHGARRVLQTIKQLRHKEGLPDA